MTVPSGGKQFLFWVGAALAATAVLIFILVGERQPPARHALYVVGEAGRGRALFYGEKQCSICHSIDGQGGRIAPDLSQTHPRSPAMGWLSTVLWNHAPGMYRRLKDRKSYPQLDEQQMADILTFLYQAVSADRPGSAALGRKVFESKGCIRCHSVRGEGGTAGPELSKVAGSGANGWTRAMWNHAGSMVRPVSTALGSWPQFMGTDMVDLIAYVRTGSPSAAPEAHGDAERGWKVFQNRCIQCHSVHGSGGKLAPELGPEQDLPLTTAQFASVLWNHAPDMLKLSQENSMAPPTLDGTEMADLAAFLASLRFFEPAGSPFIGERVFKERGCAGCHGDFAEGSKLGPRIQTIGDAFTAVSLTTSLWKHGPKMVDLTGKLGIPWPTLEPADIGNLVSFLNQPRR